MIIENKKLGISSQDVYTCEDILLLLKWRVGVSETYFEIWQKIVKALTQKEKTGVYAERSWFTQLKTAYRLQEILLFQIECRIEELKRLQ